jgi:ubiquitin-protein ligase
MASASGTATKVIKKETIQRLLKDVKQIMKHPLTDNGIYYSHDESDMMKGYALIVGPEDTPYFGGFYFFKFDSFTLSFL